MLAITNLATLLSWPMVLLQDDGGSSTPLFVIIIIVLLVIVLFWWGLGRNRTSGDSTATSHADHTDHDDHTDTAHATDDHAMDDHPMAAPTVAMAAAAMPEEEVDLTPADLNIGTVPAVAAIAEDLDDIPDQPINFGEVELEATGTVPPTEVESELPATRIEEVDLDATGNAPPVLEDMSQLAPDDLKLIEGIGPRIAAVLAEAGVTTFAELAAEDPANLEQILDQARLPLANPETWQQQAALAAAGRLDDLRQLQDKLKGGREV